jgi:hypothetical protein
LAVARVTVAEDNTRITIDRLVRLGNIRELSEDSIAIVFLIDISVVGILDVRRE